MTKRKTFAEIREAARLQARDHMLAEVCRVLRHHLDMEPAANALWEAYKSGQPLRQVPDELASFSGFDLIRWQS